MDEPAPMPEPPELRQEDVVAVIRWLAESAAWLREDMSVAASHGHPAQPQVEANLRLYEDAALLFREAYDGRQVPLSQSWRNVTTDAVHDAGGPGDGRRGHGGGGRHHGRHGRRCRGVEEQTGAVHDRRGASPERSLRDHDAAGSTVSVTTDVVVTDGGQPALAVVTQSRYYAVEPQVPILRLMTMRTAAALLLIALVSGCASGSDAVSEASDSGGIAGSAEPRGLECDGGSESAVADYFPNAPLNQSSESVGEASPEAAALQLLTFGRAFDPGAYEVDTSEDGEVTYSDAQGAVVAEVVVVSTGTHGFVATEMQVCESSLRSSSETPEVAAGEGVNFAAVRPGGEGGDDALMYGVLRADSDTGCIWLEDADGEARNQLLLQGDYEVVFEDEPVTVRRDWEVVAEVGQQVKVAGGHSQTTAGVEGCPVSAGVWLGRFE